VFVPDPASHRHAVAAEPGTTVLSFGGPPTFQPSAWEWGFQAAPLFRSDPERARELLMDGLKAHPDSPSLHYNLGCLEAITGNREAALSALREAVALDPRAAGWAREDADFAALRDDAEFRAIAERERS
jgi:tetratricopeptide (TPR) repeat protein